MAESCGPSREEIPRTGRACFEALPPLTRPQGTLSPSEGERERVRGQFIESRLMGRERCSAATGETARWRLKANSRNVMRLIIAPIPLSIVRREICQVFIIVRIPEASLDTLPTNHHAGQSCFEPASSFLRRLQRLISTKLKRKTFANT